MSTRHMGMLEKSLEAAPAYYRLTLKAVLTQVWAGKAVLFEVPNGVILFEINESNGHRRLCILCFYTNRGRLGFSIRGLAKAFKQLAGDWSCDTIETVCWDFRLVRAIIRAGGKIESCTVVLGA